MPTPVQKTVWVADDGTEHRSEREAALHEQRQELIEVLYEAGCDYPHSFADTILANADDINRILAQPIPE